MTPFSNRCEILGDLWLGYRDDEEFSDFFEYNDLGLPLAYAIKNDIAHTAPMAETLINETFDILLGALELEDTGFDSLEQLLEQSSKQVKVWDSPHFGGGILMADHTLSKLSNPYFLKKVLRTLIQKPLNVLAYYQTLQPIYP